MSSSRLTGGILLVAGTTIGAGMLALPVVTGMAGFLPTVILFFLFWIFMTFTALLMLEVNLWMEDNANMITMAKRTLGKWGELSSWGAYMFLLYALTTAYLAGCAPILLDFMKDVLGIDAPVWTGSLPVLLLFGTFIYQGVHAVDWVNRWMMIGLAIAFAAIVVLIMPSVNLKLLQHIDWPASTLAISFIATSFGFHVVIPSLTTLLKRDPEQLRKAIWIGSAIPLAVYLVWIVLTLGIIPLEGPNGIVEGFKNGSNGASLLASVLNSHIMAILARCFSFFAIITSFLGVSISLADFLADGLRIKKSALGKAFLCFLTFVPPLGFVLTDPRAFLSALDYAGAFGVMFLLGLMPALMVWAGRYLQNRASTTYKAPGGKIALIGTIIFSTSVILFEIGCKFGLFHCS